MSEQETNPQAQPGRATGPEPAAQPVSVWQAPSRQRADDEPPTAAQHATPQPATAPPQPAFGWQAPSAARPDAPAGYASGGGVSYAAGSAAPGSPAHPGGPGGPRYGGMGGDTATLPQHPAYPGQPAWQPGLAPAAGAPRSGRVGRIAGGFVLVLVLMIAAAIGGGVAGGWLVYSQTDDPGPVAAPGTTVVDGPQLDRSSLASIAAKVQPSVVSVSTGTGEGSGVVLSAEGHIVTNNHVVAPAGRGEVSVIFSDGQTARAEVIGTDDRTDIAVIQVADVSGLTPAVFGDSSGMLVGDTVLAIGSPLGFQGSVTQGIVSALDRTLALDGNGDPFGGDRNRTSLSGLIQTDASINPGNSGGALVNLAGEVIGINTAIATNGASGNIGVGFAIPSNRATQVAELLISGAEVPHPFLGVNVVTADGGGALVGDVVPDSPADAAGLRAGDVVTRIGDRPVADSNDLVSAVQSTQVGAELEVVYLRDGVEQTTTVTIGEADD